MTRLTAEREKELDCGDNSCHFAKDKGGMRTNGGCRCLSNAGFSRSAVASAYEMLPEILRLRSALDEAEKTLELIADKHGDWTESFMRTTARKALKTIEKVKENGK